MKPEKNDLENVKLTSSIDDSFMDQELKPIIGQIIDEQKSNAASKQSNSQIPFAKYFATRNKQKSLLFIGIPIILFIVLEVIKNKSIFPFFIVFYSFISAFLVISIIYGIILFFKKDQASSNSVEEDFERYKRRYRLVIVFSIVQVMSLVGLAVLFTSLSGVTGGEFIVLFSFFNFVPFLVAISFFNLIFVPLTIKKFRPTGKVLVLLIGSLLISFAILGYGGLIIWKNVAAINKFSNSFEQRKIDTELERKRNAEDNKNPEISKEEAANLLNTCQIKVLNYTNQNKPSTNDGFTTPAAELTTTGIVITRYNGQPSNLFIADRNIAELVPLARAAQIKCGKPQFWHDGSYEQYKDGKWYFKNDVVNDLMAGKSKDDAVTLMQSCKVDYIIGTTGDLTSFDSSTKAWLEKAEKTTSGIEISENAPKTFIFLAKNQTAELHTAARQFRDSCSGTRQLYIRLDKFIEVEYPTKGSWTRTEVR